LSPELKIMNIRCPITRRLSYFILVFALSLSHAWACSTRTIDGVDHEDISVQGGLVQDLVASSDVIAIVGVLEVDRERLRTKVLAKEVLKGELDQRSELAMPQRLDRFACKGSASFHNTVMRVGREYVIYLEDGKLRRAVSRVRGQGTISFESEVQIILNHR
jgi:hypothetical protein